MKKTRLYENKKMCFKKAPVIALFLLFLVVICGCQDGLMYKMINVAIQPDTDYKKALYASLIPHPLIEPADDDKVILLTIGDFHKFGVHASEVWVNLLAYYECNNPSHGYHRVMFHRASGITNSYWDFFYPSYVEAGYPKFHADTILLSRSITGVWEGTVKMLPKDGGPQLLNLDFTSEDIYDENLEEWQKEWMPPEGNEGGSLFSGPGIIKNPPNDIQDDIVQRVEITEEANTEYSTDRGLVTITVNTSVPAYMIDRVMVDEDNGEPYPEDNSPQPWHEFLTDLPPLPGIFQTIIKGGIAIPPEPPEWEHGLEEICPHDDDPQIPKE